MDELQQLTNQIEEKKRALTKADLVIEQVTADLNSNFGVSTIEEATALKETMEGQLKDLEDRQQKALNSAKIIMAGIA